VSLIGLAARIYAGLLRFYPREFRAEFEVEMRAAFVDAIAEASQRSGASLAVVLLRELRDWPAALLREHWRERRKREMDTQTGFPMTNAPTGNERLSWVETMAGLWPFLIFGPVTVLLAYPYPLPDWRFTTWAQVLMGIAYGLPLLIGLGMGWSKRWPRWSYPYLGLVLFVLGGFVGNAIFRVVFEVGPEWPFLPQALIAIGACALTTGALLLAARAWRPLRSLYQGVRRDWTQLSFGLYLGAGILFGQIDHEEDPALTAFVFLPSLIVLLGAFACLRGATKAQRSLAMLISLALAIGVRAAGGQLFYGGYGAVVGAIIFIPALLALLPPPDQSSAAPPQPIGS
jgi:hypothetical protein